MRHVQGHRRLPSVPKLTAAQGNTAAYGSSMVLKGGIAMKLAAGIVLAGAVAAGVAVVSGGGSDLPAETPRKFATPVTAPDAEWHLEGVWAGCGISGYLDGPR